MLRAIIFDFDGIIVDSEPLHYRAFLEVLRPLGVAFDWRTYQERYIGFDDRDGFRAMAAASGVEIEENELAELIGQKAAVFERIVAEGIEPYAGVVELIREASRSMPVAIASGALLSDVKAILPAIGNGTIRSAFSAIVTAEDVERSKPDPASYALAAERLGVEPGAALAIEDTPPGLASAKAAGLRTLGVSNTYPASALTEAERVVESLEGVSVKRLQDWFGCEGEAASLRAPR